jgi:hypothetical protein
MQEIIHFFTSKEPKEPMLFYSLDRNEMAIKDLESLESIERIKEHGKKLFAL